MRLSGQNALVTGSSQGIGREIALRLAHEGADVIVNYRSHPEEGEAVSAEIRALGRRSVAVRADLAVVGEVSSLVDRAVAELGGLDLLVNNAGIEVHAAFADVREEDYDRVLAVNLKGVFFATQAFVRHRRDAGRPGGRVINISSVHEDLPFPNFAAYCASKGGLKMLMRNLAIELAPLGITVNNVAPGAIETPITSAPPHDPATRAALLGNIPLARLGQGRDVGGAVVFLASDDASYVTGATLVVDGGLTWNYSEQ